jgi:hypothetical protein
MATSFALLGSNYVDHFTSDHHEYFSGEALAAWSNGDLAWPSHDVGPWTRRPAAVPQLHLSWLMTRAEKLSHLSCEPDGLYSQHAQAR